MTSRCLFDMERTSGLKSSFMHMTLYLYLLVLDVEETRKEFINKVLVPLFLLMW